MREIFLSIPVLLLCGILQSTVFSRILLLNGNADIMMLIIIAWSLNKRTKNSIFWVILAGILMSILSETPLFGYAIIYIFLWVIIFLLKKFVWQMPLILMIFMTFIGTFLHAAYSVFFLLLSNANIDLSVALNQIIIPTLFLNLILSVPIYAIFTDIANNLYPIEEIA